MYASMLYRNRFQVQYHFPHHPQPRYSLEVPNQLLQSRRTYIAGRVAGVDSTEPGVDRLSHAVPVGHGE